MAHVFRWRWFAPSPRQSDAMAFSSLIRTRPARARVLLVLFILPSYGNRVHCVHSFRFVSLSFFIRYYFILFYSIFFTIRIRFRGAVVVVLHLSFGTGVFVTNLFTFAALSLSPVVVNAPKVSNKNRKNQQQQQKNQMQFGRACVFARISFSLSFRWHSIEIKRFVRDFIEFFHILLVDFFRFVSKLSIHTTSRSI